jgi:hypothetical protein
MPADTVTSTEQAAEGWRVGGVLLSDTTASTADSSQFTKVPYAAEQWDSHNEYDPQTSTFTAGQLGIYRVCASLASF